MREIKFRVWDNGAKMYQQMSAMMNVHTGHISDLPERHILEQFTGLHDKNGREIYEGDILQSVGAHRQDERRAIVSWCDDDSKFEAMPIGCVGTPWDLGALNPRFWEVIGNIHEHDDPIPLTPERHELETPE